MNEINSFKELLNEISWSYDYPNYEFIKYEDGAYCLNKLYITRDRVSYKTDSWTLAPGVFDQFERFINFLNSTDDHFIKNL